MVTKKIKEFYKNIDKPIRKFFLFSCLDATVGAIGMIVYGILTSTYGPVWVRNQYFGLWLTTILFYYSCQSFYGELRHWKSKAYYYIDLVYFMISSILPLLLIIFYGIAVRIDGIVWSIYLFAVNLTNILILYLRKKELKNKESINNNEILIDKYSKNINQEIKSERPKWKNILIQVLKVLNGILRGFFIIVFCFLINGAIIESVGKLKYPARGKIVDVKISNSSDKTIKFHYLCDGPENSSQPVFLFEGSASHGLADYLTLQTLLKQKNRRSCIWDKPGLGYSNYLYTEIKFYDSIYDNLIKSLDEKGPFEFVGWGGGGSLLYEYALQNPKMFKSLTFLDVAPNNIEFTIPYVLKNWTQDQLSEYKNKEYASRKALFGIINGIGVPFGLMSIFIPPYKSYLSYFENEINWYFHTEKTWITQEYVLPTVLKDNRNMSEKLDQQISLNIIMSVKSDDQIRILVCKKRGFPFESKECIYEIESNKLSVEYRLGMTNLSSNSKVFNCTLDECDLGYFVGIGANYTVDTLLQI